MKKLSRLIKYAVLAAVLTVAFSATGVAQEAKVYQVLPAKAPVIEGNLTDGCWTDAKWASGFIETITGTGIASVQTRFAAVRDNEAIYFAVECLEPEMDKLVSRVKADDGPLWEDDCVEILIDAAGKDALQHLIINPDGFKYDSDLTAGGAAWNPVWQAKTAKGPDRWTVEARIPFASLRIKQVEGQTWKVNVCRERAAGKRQLSGWSDPLGDFQKPQGFGVFIFGKYSDQLQKTIIPEWKQIRQQVSQFRDSANEEDKKLITQFDRASETIDPVVIQCERKTDITREQYSELYALSQSLFPQFHDKLNAAEINRLLDEGTK